MERSCKSSFFSSTWMQGVVAALLKPEALDSYKIIYTSGRPKPTRPTKISEKTLAEPDLQ
jgi:hypothetical protein